MFMVFIVSGIPGALCNQRMSPRTGPEEAVLAALRTIRWDSLCPAPKCALIRVDSQVRTTQRIAVSPADSAFMSFSAEAVRIVSAQDRKVVLMGPIHPRSPVRDTAIFQLGFVMTRRSQPDSHLLQATLLRPGETYPVIMNWEARRQGEHFVITRFWFDEV